MSSKRAGVAVTAAGVGAAVAVGILHDYHNIAIALFVSALAILGYAIFEFFRPDEPKQPTQSGGPGGPGGSASVGIGMAQGGKGGRGGEVIGGRDVRRR